MWSARRLIIDVYVGQTHAAVVCGDDHLWSGPWSLNQSGLAQVREVFRQRPGVKSIRVWLSGWLCRPWMYDPSLGMSKSEREAVATINAQTQTGFSSSKLRLWKADASRRVPLAWRTKMALGGLSLAADEEAIESMEAAWVVPVITSVAPWWGEIAMRWKEQLRVDGVVAIEDSDSVTVIGLDKRGQSRSWGATVLIHQDRDVALASIDRTLVAKGIERTEPLTWITLGDANLVSRFPWLVDLPLTSGAMSRGT